MPTKILEIKGNDWLKGVSLQDTYPIGGLFQSNSVGFDPFDLMGFFRTYLTPVQIDDTKVLIISNSCTSGSDGTNGYAWFMGNRASTGQKQIYAINTTTQAVTDFTFTGGNATGAMTCGGLITYKGKLVTADNSNGTIYSVAYTGGSEVVLRTPTGWNVSNQQPVFHVAPDKNLYFCRGVNNGEVGKLTSVSGASGSDAAFTGDTSLTPKDLTSDGRFEIIIMDDNPTRVANLASTCNVYFWDMDKADADVVLTIPDSYLISARFVDGRLLVIGASGIWQCGIGTAPRLIVPLVSTQLPTNPYMVTVQNNIMYWASASSGARIHAYGAKIGNPIWFLPYQTTGSNNLHTTLVSAGTSFYAGLDAGTNTTKIYVHNTGSTRSNATAVTAPQQLSNPWTFSYAKVALKAPLSSGQAIALTVKNGDDTTIMPVTTKQFSVDGAKKTFIFQPAGGTVKQFEDISLTINPQGGAVVQRVAIYGEPVEDSSQLI